MSAVLTEPKPVVAFTRDVRALMERDNVSGDEMLVLPSEYLEVVIERR